MLMAFLTLLLVRPLFVIFTRAMGPRYNCFEAAFSVAVACLSAPINYPSVMTKMHQSVTALAAEIAGSHVKAAAMQPRVMHSSCAHRFQECFGLSPAAFKFTT
jgi:hypothetical protein